MEASGTSGMKLPPNGGLNLSVLDGWWCEGYNGKNGWAIGSEIKDPLDPNLKPEFQSEVDSASLFHILETQIIPLYYAKPDGRLPIAWLQLMRESIRSVTPVFNTHRMVTEYNERLYEPAADRHRELSEKNCAKATEISQWKARIRHDWPQVRISDVHLGSEDRLSVTVGEKLTVSVRLHLGDIDPKFVRVQAYFGETANAVIAKATIVDLNDCTKADRGDYLYHGEIPAMESGAYGLNVRVIPTHPMLTQAHELRLITWAR
jgi:starch phosphorylase